MRSSTKSLSKRLKVDDEKRSRKLVKQAHQTPQSLMTSVSPRFLQTTSIGSKRSPSSFDDNPKISIPQRLTTITIGMITFAACISIWHQQMASHHRNFNGRSLRPKESPFLAASSSMQKEQRAFILVGSSAVGFEEIESDLREWNKNYLLKNGNSYPLPDLSPEMYNATDGFRPLLKAIEDQTSGIARGYASFSRQKRNQTEFLIEEFRQTFNNEWMKNKNFIIGIDAFRDLSSSHGDNVLQSQFFETLLSLFPWYDKRFPFRGSNDNVTAIILYRSRRVARVTSLWENTPGDQSFSTWAKNFQDFHELDTFSIAETLRKMGVHLAIVDVDHVLSNGLSLSHYIACNILGVQCDDSGYILNADREKITPWKGRVRKRTHGILDIKEGAMKKFILPLQQNECSYDFIRNGENVDFYPTKLKTLFSWCTGGSLSPSSKVEKLKDSW
eukprot:CAMPEP_0194087448 /NCGR_PEP_ID=MMETSP0149-20130528/25067_1 /TAXON_ID=122233 /ORGANISM="Chaetoceros debilis, Strain MM31A-1" /LENGTH=443 /DNA_ID=CAMNT_0038770801 /DNA_START=144 /DNA_END=1472 /DNA_ORIENTATION=-